MDLRILRYFLAVVREQSITAAAQSMHITQPTLSRQLMELEEEIGAPLLVRGKRNQGIVLTEKGMLLRRRAEELVELADRTQLELCSDEVDVSGTVSIGGGESEAMHLLARVARDLLHEYPGIRYTLYSGNAEDVKERLNKGLLDFGLFIGPTDLEKYDSFPLPMRDVWGLLVPKDDPLAGRDCLQAEDLQRLPLLFSRQQHVSSPVSQWMGADASQLNIVATYNLVYNAACMVAEGVGYALTLDKLVNTTGDSPLRFIPLYPPLESILRVAWKKYQPLSPATELFLKRLRAACQNAAAQTT